jgi:anti-sigma B factor antagonist
MAEPQIRLKVSESAGIHVVSFADRKILEELSISQIGDQLTDLVSGHPRIKLVLNFEQVEHLSSAALGMLITLRNKVEATHGQLKLANIKPQIYEVFKITQLYKLFDISNSVSDAEARF